MSPAVSAALAGLVFGLSLIVAIGAQNAFVLRQGLRREHVGAVVAICAGSDVILISAGIAGLGAVVNGAPRLLTVIRFGGAAFLLCYAFVAARRAWRPTALRVEPEPAREPGGTDSGGTEPQAPSGGGRRPWRLAASDPTARRGTVLTCLALTWLNPHVYLDTVVLLGSVANTHGAWRWAFGAGAIAGSFLWFSALGYGARLLGPVFARPAAWRVLDVVIALTMSAIAIRLLTGL